MQGTLPDHMDIWRIKPTGGTPERMTNHNSIVSYPVFLNGEKITEYVNPDPARGTASPAFLGLQTHTGRVAFRKIQIQEVP